MTNQFQRDCILTGAFSLGQTHARRGLLANRAFFGDDVSMFNEYVRGRADELGISLADAFAPYYSALQAVR